jgi:energy-coupling factor transporter ATP-binding protein EcfA2
VVHALPETTASYWLSTVHSEACLENTTRPTHPREWYRFGDGVLGLHSDHAGFRVGFERIFGGCRHQPRRSAPAVQVICDVQPREHGNLTLVEFQDPEPLDVVEFALQLFADRGCREVQPGAFTGRAFGFPGDEGKPEIVIGSVGRFLVVHNGQPWESVIGNVAIHMVLRLQRDMAVFHAASVAVAGQGVLIVGPKGSGKTTLALTLASLGHAFYGDEMAALRLDSLELLPQRRSLSIRFGVRSPQVDAALRLHELPLERFPDGEPRIRARIDQLFPSEPPDPVRLSHIVFLRGRRATPLLEEFRPQREHLALLPPLRSTLWSAPPAERAFRLLSILPRVRCVWLDAGHPDQTADVVEKMVQHAWH